VGAVSAAALWGSALLSALTVLAIVLSALLERSGPVRLRHWAEEAGGALLALYERPARFEVYRFVLASLAKVAPVMLVVSLRALLAGLGWPRPAWTAGAAVVALVVALEMLNRRLVGWEAEEWLRRLTFAYRLARLATLPLVAALAPLAPAGPSENGDEEDEEDEVSDEEIEAFIELGTREGILEPEEGEMVWGIVDFGDTQVRSVMTPRVDMVVASAEEGLDALAERFIESGHSRLPVYEESIDKIVGILHIREVLRGLRSEPRPAVRELAKPPFFVPERRSLDELLKEMQARFQQIAIVLDEYGGTAGLVTVEDLLEEIVGEIFDEDEVFEPEVTALPDGSWRLDGRTPVEELDELFGVDLEEEPYETVAGVVLSVHGSVPEEGEVIEAHGLRFVVEEVAGRRVQALRVEKIVPEAPAQIEEETA
jgi:CBS domain containing-hemolysin-like protein